MVDFAALGFFFMVQHENPELERRFHREAIESSKVTYRIKMQDKKDKIHDFRYNFKNLSLSSQTQEISKKYPLPLCLF